MEFTKAQENAVNAGAGTMLVSAGAGSGKTSVLTERIIKKISDPAEYCDITDFLVVTFTRASAADLKNKISKAISKKIAEDINNTHLKRQQINLGRANISTIHSFCYDLSRDHFEKLGIPAIFRMSDENEISIIKRALLDGLLEKYYAEGSDVYKNGAFSCRDFIFAVENFLGARDDENIYSVILKIHNRVTSNPEGFAFFDEQIELMGEIADYGQKGDKGPRTAFFSTKFGKNICGLLRDDIFECLSELKKMTAQISSARFFALDEKYSGAIEAERMFFSRLAEILDGENPYSYDDAYNWCENFANVKIGSHRLDKNDAEMLGQKEIIDKKNKRVREKINYIRALFSHDFENIKRFAQNYKKSISVLKDFTESFEQELSAEKRRLKSFEFSDLERFAVKLLIEKIGENGEIYTTDLARRIKNDYKEIYIDEYQDTNKMQDAIFRAISAEDVFGRHGNRFMVGDIKQSIYAFRGAKPDIFAGYSKAFEEYGNFESEGEPKKIYLKKNFRSSKNIIDFINHVFSALFSEKLGGVSYTGGEVLESGKIFEISGKENEEIEENEEGSDVTFALIEKETEKTEETEEIEEAEETEESGDGEEGDLFAAVSAEAEYVALTVKKLLESGKLKNGEPLAARHIAILMRNYTKSGIYADALKKYGVACYTDRAKGFLSSAEIMLFVSLLRTIDNPTRDIDLAAVLKSPLFSFCLDDLIYIKKAGGGLYSAPFFRYLQAYEKNPGGIFELKNKCADFLAELNSWRAKSRTLSVDKFIWYLYRQTDIMAKISTQSHAEERKANLILLYEYARKFEETAFRGLYGFLNYLKDVENGRDDFERAKVTSENNDAVKIMSVHKAKGLEFPICILANTGGLFNSGDYRGNPVISEGGVYYDLKSEDEIGMEKTPFKKIFAEKVKNDAQSEEARILYVALTRAAEKLIITGGVKNINKFLAKNTENADAGLSGANCALGWLAPILLDSGGKTKTKTPLNIDLVYADKLREMAEKQNNGAGPAKEQKKPETEDQGDFAGVLEKIRHMYDFEYKREILSKVPAKVLVTKLKPGVLTEDEYIAQTLKELEMAPLPRFIEETAESPALAGTAAHLFLQFADFEFAEIFGAQNEAENLLSKRFINEAQYSRIKFYPIDKFFSSDLYAKIKAAKRVYRETPFNLKVPVSEFFGEKLPYSGEEYILIQGAIDLFFEDESGRVYIVDFKTDQVHKPDGEQILIRRHKEQIKYYRTAVGEILHRPVDGAYIYSFALGEAVPVDN